MRRRNLFHLALAAAFVLLGASCLSPTLPLPPPDVETVQSAGPATRWTVAGACQPGAVVSVFNDTQNQGVLFEDTDFSGRFFVEITADLCDSAWVSQVSGTLASTEVPFVIEPQSPNDPGVSTACH